MTLPEDASQPDALTAVAFAPEAQPETRRVMPPELLGPLHQAAPWKPGPHFYLQAPLALTMAGLGAWQLGQGQSPVLLVLGLGAVAMVAYRVRLGREGPPGVQGIRLRPEALELHDTHEGLLWVPYAQVIELKRLHRRGGQEYLLRLEDGRAYLLPGNLNDAAVFEAALARACALEWTLGEHT